MSRNRFGMAINYAAGSTPKTSTVICSDVAATTPADIVNYDGDPIASSTVSLLPTSSGSDLAFRGPDGVGTLYCIPTTAATVYTLTASGDSSSSYVQDGSITNAKVASNAAIAESKLSLASDAAAGTASRRSLGLTSTQAAAGNDARIGQSPHSNLKPAGAIAETLSRGAGPAVAGAGVALTSAALTLTAIWLPAGAVISNISYQYGTTGCASSTNWWYGLYDSSRVQLAVTADQTSTVITATSIPALAIAQVAAGAASSFTTTYTGLHYVGIMVKATTPPTICGSITAGVLLSIPPALVGTSDTAQTTPPAFAHTAGALSTIPAIQYAFVA